MAEITTFLVKAKSVGKLKNSVNATQVYLEASGILFGKPFLFVYQLILDTTTSKKKKTKKKKASKLWKSQTVVVKEGAADFAEGLIYRAPSSGLNAIFIEVC